VKQFRDFTSLTLLLRLFHDQTSWSLSLLIIEVGIADTDINLSIRLISKDSEEKKNFVTSLTKGVSNLNSSDIRTKEDLESLVQQLAYMFENVWNNHLKLKRIMKYSKE